MTTDGVKILGAYVHYGVPTVDVEPVSVDDVQGYSVLVDEFVLYGSVIMGSGFKMLKSGDVSARRVTVNVPVPVVVRDVLLALDQHA